MSKTEHVDLIDRAGGVDPLSFLNEPEQSNEADPAYMLPPGIPGASSGLLWPRFSAVRYAELTARMLL